MAGYRQKIYPNLFCSDMVCHSLKQISCSSSRSCNGAVNQSQHPIGCPVDEINISRRFLLTSLLKILMIFGPQIVLQHLIGCLADWTELLPVDSFHCRILKIFQPFIHIHFKDQMAGWFLGACELISCRSLFFNPLLLVKVSGVVSPTGVYPLVSPLQYVIQSFNIRIGLVYTKAYRCTVPYARHLSRNTWANSASREPCIVWKRCRSPLCMIVARSPLTANEKAGSKRTASRKMTAKRNLHCLGVNEAWVVVSGKWDRCMLAFLLVSDTKTNGL